MELIIFIGLQAAGKSTFFRTRLSEKGYTYVSKDLLSNNRRPEHRQQELIEAALQAGTSVVVDNTNPTLESRAALIRLGQQYQAEITGYYFVPEVKLSLERNKQRSGKARVPDVAIFTTRKKLVPPSFAEGFARLYQVRAGDDGSFAVEPYTEPVDRKAEETHG
ncbi:ATP-binding protein [Ktedonosporobacter rubrisoli]|uniref:ATP-binding protein n=1 Tax=Ktedonosporobacter rubrisoli TaxID=2509675 RepID=A0A4P6K2D7_KTERU|nr:ATP-binding protein [Ktedonosporobacter rubrisoli]QBD82013.1 ATP-binding protein [Ktedonosporobacter rubrisoli]